MKKNTKNARINVRTITFTAVMAALVFVFTCTFKIPFVNGYTHIVVMEKVSLPSKRSRD